MEAARVVVVVGLDVLLVMLLVVGLVVLVLEGGQVAGVAVRHWN